MNTLPFFAKTCETTISSANNIRICARKHTWLYTVCATNNNEFLTNEFVNLTMLLTTCHHIYVTLEHFMLVLHKNKYLLWPHQWNCFHELVCSPVQSKSTCRYIVTFVPTVAQINECLTKVLVRYVKSCQTGCPVSFCSYKIFWYYETCCSLQKNYLGEAIWLRGSQGIFCKLTKTVPEYGIKLSPYHGLMVLFCYIWKVYKPVKY